MSDFNYIFLSLKSRLSNTLLTILLTAFGVSIGIILIQFENHINDRLEKDGKGIDIVVGAKGSPLQIVLSSIYHIDIPTGNIPYETVNKLSNDPQIKKIIPLALGDNWKGFRIVGTNYDYLKHYRSEIKEGRKWNKKFEAVAGASVDTELYDTFLGSHGLTENDNTHNHHKYKVVGILAKTGTVIDRLLLTSLNSVMDIHNLKNIDENLDHNNSQNHGDKIQKKSKKIELHDNHGHKNSEKDEYYRNHENHNHENHNHGKEKINKDTNKYSHVHDHKPNENNEKKNNHVNNLQDPEITSLLITTSTPIANLNLPRSINKNTQLQAANPAFEITRLSSMLGFGSQSFKILSIILIAISVLSIFSGLASNFENRLSDLAILRALGYTKSRIFKIISLEGIVIVSLGLIIGILSSVIFFGLLSEIITPLKVSGAKFKFTIDILIICILVVIAGLLAALYPAYKGSRVSVINQLSR